MNLREIKMAMRLNRLCLAMATVFVVSATTEVAAEADDSGLEKSNVVWDSPSKDSRGSMPIGNGDIGANVWVEPSGDLVLLLSKTDSWDENMRLVKLGRVRVRLSPAPDTKAGFRQELKLRDGAIEIQTAQATLRVWIDANHPVVQVDGKSSDGRPMNVTASVEIWRTEKKPCDPGYPNFVEPVPFSWPDTVMKSDGSSVVWYHHNVVSPYISNLKIQKLEEIAKTEKDPILGRTFGAAMCGEGFTSGSDTRLQTAKPRAEFSLHIHALTQPATTADAWHADLMKQITVTEAVPTAERRANHRKWWAAFWQRSWIFVDGDKQADAVSRGYNLHRWMNACNGRGAFPIKFNGAIFNVDFHEEQGAVRSGDADYRAWGGCCWFQNTRLSYWPMIASGDFDLMQPFFDFYKRNLPIRRLATKTYYGHEGAFFPETMTLWGTYNDRNYGPNRKGKPDGLTDNTFIRRYWQNGLEMVAMMLDYHDCTQDAAFHDETLLPHAAEILAFFDQHWPRGKDGKILFSPAQSLETWHTATNPMPEVAGLRYVIPRLQKLTENAELRASWQKTLDDLPPVPMKVAPVKRLLPAEKFGAKSNLENPELYAVFPYRLYTLAVGGEALEIGRNSYSARRHKDNHCWYQSPIQAALLGLADDSRKGVVERPGRVQAGFRFPAMWGQSFDWPPDQDHGGVMQAALQSMLMQCEGDKILLLPAWPKEWDVNFKLHAPKQTTVEGVCRSGNLEQLKVTPEFRRKDVVVMKAQ